MKRIIPIILVLLVCASMALTGCAKMGESTADEAYPASPPYDEAVAYKPGAIGSQSGENDNSIADILAGRKIIRNAELKVQTLEFDAFLEGVSTKLNELGGYVESRTVNERDNYWKSSYQQLRSANMVLRIPAEKLDGFLNAVDGMGNVVSRNENVADVTESYTDTEAKLASLRTEYDTLLGLLEKAQDLQQILTLQERLTSVRYEMESLEGRLNNYDSEIAFSKVTMNVSEVERETPVEKESFGQEVSRRFKESAQDVGEGLRRFAAWLIGDFPLIAVWLLILVGIPLLIIIIVLRSIKRRKKRLAEEQKPYKTAEAAETKE